jgi:hypothetical protein
MAVNSSMLAGKTMPPPPRKRKVDASETILQEEHDAEQEEQEIEAMDLAMKEGMEAAAETAEKLRQLDIAEGIAGEDKMDVEGAPPSPAGSDKMD